MDREITRREFTQQALGSLALFSLFGVLKDKDLFAQVSIHPELDTVTWPNGADLAPEFLYRAARPQVVGA